jgi:RNA polymerase sigma-70 factor (ECF subfamily)
MMEDIVMHEAKIDINVMDKEILFEEVYKAYYSSVYRYIFVAVKNSWITEDILAEVFMKIYKHREEIINVEVSNRWIFRIAHNALIDFYRKNNRVEFVDEIVGEGIDEFGYEYVMIKEEFEKIKILLEEFSEETQKMVFMRFCSGLKFREIAEVFSMPENTVKCRVSRTIKKLRERYDVIKEYQCVV